MRIQSGGHTNNEAIVDTEGRLSVFSVSEEEDKHVNKHRGKVWSCPFTVTPTGAGDYFFYLKNTGTEDYFITDVRIDAASAEVIGVHVVTGTASAGTTITPVNRNLGTTVSPDATIEYSVDTTGLTDAGEVFFLTCEANKLSHLRTTSNIIITPGSSIALKATTGAVALKCMVSLVGGD